MSRQLAVAAAWRLYFLLRKDVASIARGSVLSAADDACARFGMSRSSVQPCVVF